jgi:hypothetical protein
MGFSGKEKVQQKYLLIIINCEGKYGLEIYEIGHEKGKQVYTILSKS